MNKPTTFPKYINSDRIGGITIKSIPSAVLLELIFVYIPLEEIIQLLLVCHNWNHLLSQSCLTLEGFWRNICLTNGIPMLLLDKIKKKKKKKNRKRKERLKKQIKWPSVDDSKINTKINITRKKRQPLTRNVIIETLKSVYLTDNIIKEVCKRVFYSKNVFTKPSWRHCASAQRILFKRWRDTPNDKTKRGNKITENPNNKSYSTYHFTTPDIVGSWILMCEERYLVYSTNRFINIIDVNTMKPPSSSFDPCQQKDDIPLSTIKLPVPILNEHGWLMPLSSTSPWVVISFGSCIQMSNIITGESFHNLNPQYSLQQNNVIPESKIFNITRGRLGCVADGYTTQPVAFTYAKPTLERWDLNTMTMTTPFDKTISGVDIGIYENTRIRMEINDSHSMIIISQLSQKSNIIDYRSNTLVYHSTIAGEVIWRNNSIFIADRDTSYLFDIRRGLSSPLWSRSRLSGFNAIDINNAGMIAYHNYNSSQTILCDLFNYDEGNIWTNPVINISKVKLTDDRLYLCGFTNAIVFDYSKYLPNNFHI